ncbi:MAG: flagellar protein [Alphaproteobacteria bacterium HGW-Alphaproteobacteria-13]|nr:MAG: flagellar protein [Alphaproteobacteria bacterium HGW-Alphaproteobacteria-13]
MRRGIIASLTLFAATAAPAATAQQATQDWQTVDMLTQAVAGAMGRTAVPIDRRIVLASCPEQPAISALDAQALAVRCPSLGWRLRVPLLGAPDNGAADNMTAAPARQTRPAAAPVIRRGDNVRVSIDTASFSIGYAAVATQDGGVGDTIALRGADAKNLLSATVVGPGRARIID